MNFRSKPDRFRGGRPISARQLNRITDLADSRAVTGGPGVSAVGGPFNSVLQATEARWYFAFTPVGGIPARTGSPPSAMTPGSELCPIYEYDGSALDNFDGRLRLVLNAASGAVPGGKLIRIEPRWGAWWVVNNFDCA